MTIEEAYDAILRELDIPTITKRYVHQFVLEAFIGNPLNNKLDNLRWDTPSNNDKDKYRHGTHSVPEYSHPGEKHPSHILTEKDVIEVKRLILAGERVIDIARRYPEVSRYAISDIRRGKSWRLIPWPNL